jgi:legumain
MYYLINQENDIPAEKIILMTYDDIVNSASNPFQGQIFRSLDHKNIYPGAAALSYSGKQVTAENFYKVLTGDSSAGRALQSTSNDNVMVFFDNHGGSGILGVPEGNGDYIYADDLKNAFQKMHDNGLYKNCFFPITACYSASVAQVVDGVPNLYMMTASNDHESSMACLYDSSLQTYLSSEFSLVSQTYWESNPTAVLGDTFQPIVDGVKESHVCEYGDTSVKQCKVNDFFGNPRNGVRRNKIASTFKLLKAKETEARLSILSIKSTTSKVAKLTATIESAIEKRASDKVDAVIAGLRSKFQPKESNSVTISDWANYKAVLRHMQKSFNYLGESFYAKTFFFANLANQYKAEEIIAEINKLI